MKKKNPKNTKAITQSSILEKDRYPTDKLHKRLELLLIEYIVKQELLTSVNFFFLNSLQPVFDN